MSSFFDEIKDELTKAGANAEPAPQPKPAPKPAVVVVAPEPEIIKAPLEPVAAAKISIEPEIVKYSPVTAPPAAPEAMRLYDSVGVFRGVLLPDGTFEGVTSAGPAAAPFSNLSEEDRAPVIPEDEARVDLPQRTSGRIIFLTATYESDKEDPTHERRRKRLENDIHRGLAARTSVERDPERSAAAQSINQWKM
jgi:hypothetical protein